MKVRKKDNEKDVYDHHFSEGKLWYFNSDASVEHSVANNGDSDRWHLWINARVIDNNFNVVGHPGLYTSLINGTHFRFPR
jgi:hypothetical protein